MWNGSFTQERLISWKTRLGLKYGFLDDERCTSHPITWRQPPRRIVTFFSGLQTQHVWGSYLGSRKDKCEWVCWRLIPVINVKWMLKSGWGRYFQVRLPAAFRLFQLTLTRMGSVRDLTLLPPHLPGATQTQDGCQRDPLWSALIHLQHPRTWKCTASKVDTF